MKVGALLSLLFSQVSYLFQIILSYFKSYEEIMQIAKYLYFMGLRNCHFKKSLKNKQVEAFSFLWH